MTPEIYTNILVMCEFTIKQAGMQAYKLVHDVLEHLRPLAANEEMQKNFEVIRAQLDQQVSSIKEIVSHVEKAQEPVKEEPVKEEPAAEPQEEYSVTCDILLANDQDVDEKCCEKACEVPKKKD